MLHVSATGEVSRVPDLARSRAFYEDVLGLSIYREYGIGGVATGVVYFLGGGYLASGPGEPSHEWAYANAGGVTVSYFEWVQSMQWYPWTLEEIRRRPEIGSTLERIHRARRSGGTASGDAPGSGVSGRTGKS